jgi:putative ABC transport system permease protein
MRFADLLRLAWDNLRRNRTRSLLTGTGVAVGVAALLALLAYGAGLQQTAQREFNALELYNTLRVTSNRIPFLTGATAMVVPDSVRAPGEQVPLTDSLVQQITALDGVLAAYPEVTFPAKLRTRRAQTVVSAEAIPMAFRQLDAYQPEAGGFFESADDNGLLIGRSMAQRLGYPSPEAAVGDTVRLVTASINFKKLRSVSTLFASGINALPMGQRPYPMVIRGVLGDVRQPVSGLTRVLLPIDHARDLRKVTFFSTLDLLFRNAETRAGYSAVRVHVADEQNRAAVQRRIEQMGVYVASFEEQFGRLEQLFVVMDLALAIIGIIALLVASLGMANTVTMSVRERYAEIGIMMAIGGTATDLQRLFVVESGLLGALGAGAGMLAGGAMVGLLDWGVNLYLQNVGVPPLTVFAVTPWMVGAIFFGALLVCLLAGVLPARRASRIEPADALRTA